jgi:uncharacterized membrane protein YqaE (UPF0057 family)
MGQSISSGPQLPASPSWPRSPLRWWREEAGSPLKSLLLAILLASLAVTFAKGNFGDDFSVALIILLSGLLGLFLPNLLRAPRVIRRLVVQQARALTVLIGTAAC